MPETSFLSILHLSDFHYTKRKSRDQKVVVDALLRDLEDMCSGHRRPDLVMFTGDLVNWGGVDSHSEAYDFLLAGVSEATGCADERIFIAPGNHDLAQKVVGESKDAHQEWQAVAGDMNQMNALYEKAAFQEIGDRKFSAYRDLERYLNEDTIRHRNQFATVHRIDPLNIDIAIVNTAMLSVGGHKDFEGDEGKLAVPEYALLETAEALTEGSFRIYATHHPTGMLSEAGERLLRRSIEQNADVHLFGHMHDPEARNSISFAGELFSDQVGAVFTHRREAYIGYSLITLDRATKNFETHLRTYFDDRKAFDQARDVVPEGKFYSSHEARQFWRTVAAPVDENQFRMHLNGSCFKSLKAEIDASEADRDAHEKFVPPPLKRTAMQAATGDATLSFVETPVPFEELVEEDSNAILYASAEYGRTTVLKEMSYRLLADAADVRFPRMPIMVDFVDVKQNSDRLLRVVRGRCYDPPEGVNVESLLKLGYACLLFDDVNFSDTKRMKVLRDFVERYPKVRYVLSSVKSSAAPYGAHVDPEMPIHFDFVELCVLRRRDMRQLVTKFNAGDVDTVLDRLQSEFQEINLPFTAANGTILMSIFEENRGFSPINRSVLIEQFVDTTLRKAAMEQSRRETFDYANKTALLAFVAAWMARVDNYKPGAEEVRAKMKEYIDRIGLNAPLDGLMSEFLAARIFVKKPDDRLSFRYRAVLEYFIALHMANHSEFKTWVMAEERYLKFVNEIQYYAGKLRHDAELVEEIGRRFETIVERLEEEDREFNLHSIASVQLPRGDDELSDHLLEQYLDRPLTQEERDEELEAELPKDVESRQEVFRPAIENPGHELIVSLVLYSGVVKNMELVDDAVKRRHLNAVWRGWAIFWLQSLFLVPAIARRREVRINGVLYKLNAPQGMSDADLARAISLNMPTGISKLVSAGLGTEKLERQLVEPELEGKDQPLAFEFLRSSLIADLKLSATGGALKAALETLRRSPYLREALIWKIADLRRMNRIADRHMNTIAAPLAGAIADLKGGSKNARESEKRRQLDRMRKERLMLTIKRQNKPE